MQEKNWSWRLKFAILLFFSSSSIAFFPLGANAQLIPDGTLSEEPSRVAPQGLRDLIEAISLWRRDLSSLSLKKIATSLLMPLKVEAVTLTSLPMPSMDWNFVTNSPP